MQWVVGSILHGGPIEQFLVPASALSISQAFNLFHVLPKPYFSNSLCIFSRPYCFVSSSFSLVLLNIVLFKPCLFRSSLTSFRSFLVCLFICLFIYLFLNTPFIQTYIHTYTIAFSYLVYHSSYIECVCHRLNVQR